MTTTLPVAGSTAQLQTRLAGRVLTPGDEAYESHSKAWNLTYAHRPDLIVIPESTADVATAVRHAAVSRQPVAVQATGHGVARVARGGMLILTHRLDDVIIDADAWTARLGGGVKWQKVLGPAAAVGLAPLLGSTPDVSAVGYTLGGGMGWMARKYGLSADQVRSIELVTADGEIRLATPHSDADLFWALRGGGAGSFGVVTALEIDLVPVASLYAGNLLYPAEMAREVAARYRAWIADAPDELTSSIVFMNYPPVDDVPEPIRGRSFAIIRGALIGSDADGEALLSFWRRWQVPAVDLWDRIPFTEIATVSNDPVEPTAGMATSEWFDALDDSMIDILVRAVFEQDGASPLTLAELRHAGGAIARPPRHANAYGNRARRHLLEMIGVTDSESDRVQLETFLDIVRAELAPFISPGVYLNFLEGEEKVRRTREGFEPESWERLRKIKERFDPTNMFSHGLAIS